MRTASPDWLCFLFQFNECWLKKHAECIGFNLHFGGLHFYFTLAIVHPEVGS